MEENVVEALRNVLSRHKDRQIEVIEGIKRLCHAKAASPRRGRATDRIPSERHFDRFPFLRDKVRLIVSENGIK